MGNSGDEPLDFLQATIGSFGRWQCKIFILMALLKIPIAWFQLGIVFMAPPTKFWCRQPEDFKYNMSTEQWRSKLQISEKQSPCLMANLEYKDLLGNTTTPCKWGYDYDKSVAHSSIISEWNLICGQEYLVNIVQITFMCGVLLGGIIFGVLSDKYGRKKILIICLTMQAILGVTSSCIPWYISFIIIRFFLALANGGTVVTSFVMCMEVVSGKWRTIIPVLYQVPFGLGNTIMAIAAYYLREWRQLQLVLSCCSIVFISYHWFIAESPRWLVATNNKNDAIKVLEKALRFNKIQNKNVKAIMNNYFTNEQIRSRFCAVFRNKKLRNATIVLCFEWFFLGNVFYAFTQYLGVLGDNVFLNVSVGGLITIPGSILCLIVLSHFGRKWTITIAHIIMSLTFFVLIFEDEISISWVILSLAAVGIICLSMSTSALFLYTGEMYPTVVRNSAVGCCLMFVKAGAIVAPFIYATREYAKYLPLTIMCIMAALDALLLYPLPETREMALSDNMKQIEMSTINGAVENEQFLENNERSAMN